MARQASVFLSDASCTVLMSAAYAAFKFCLYWNLLCLSDSYQEHCSLDLLLALE